MTIRIKSWLTCLTLQVGIMFTAADFFSTAIGIMVSSLEDVKGTHAFSFNVIANAFSMLMIFTWALAFIGAYWQYSNLMLASLILWTTYILAWMAAVFMTYLSIKFSNMLCADRRCPLSMWLYMTRIRLSFNDKLDYFYDIEHEQGPDLPIQDPFSYYDTPDGIVRTVVSNERSTTLVMAFALLGFFIIWYIGKLSMTWILLYSYYKELKCIEMFMPCSDICKDAEPTIIHAV